MIKHITGLCIVFLLLAPLSVAAKNDVPGEYFDSVIQQATSNNVPAALALLDEIIKIYPNSIKAHKMRGELFWGQARGEEALSDFERLIELQPDNQEVLLNRCLLLESMGKERNVTIHCYSGVVEKIQRSIPPESLKGNEYYTLAALLAEVPEAAAIKKRFLESLDDTSDIDSIKRDYIDNFDRRKLKQGYNMLKELRLQQEQLK